MVSWAKYLSFRSRENPPIVVSALSSISFDIIKLSDNVKPYSNKQHFLGNFTLKGKIQV